MILNIYGYSVLIDDEDAELIGSYTWHPGSDKAHVYFYTYVGANRSTRKHIGMHRFLMGCSCGDGKIVDHINRNTLDNRKGNLRVCTQRDNLCNSGLRTDNSSGYKGVCFGGRTKNWIAQIHYNNEGYSIGTAETAKEAAKLYDRVAIKLFGEFANTNFSRNDYSLDEIEAVYAKFTDVLACNNTSGYRGVYYHKRDEIWTASINCNKVRHYLGTFSDPEKAARARDKRAIELYGDKAILNFPREDYIKECNNEQETAE